MKWVGISLAVLVGLIALAFVLELGGLQWKRFFGPKHEAVRREVFEETRSYNEAKMQQLAKYKLEYERTTDLDEKEALKAAICTMFANYDDTRMPQNLQAFLREMRGY